VSTGDDGTVPNAPSGVTATAGTEIIKLNWTAPTQNTDSSPLKDLFQYRIYRNTSNNFGTATPIGRVAADIFTDGSLLGGQTYYYWVTALDYTGNESAASPVAFATASEIVTERSNGVFYIGVGSLPTTSTFAHAYFVNAIGTPVDKDQAWFYKGTLADPTEQSVWIYEEGSGPYPENSWNYQEHVLVGDLLVDGTITANKIVLDNATIESDGSGQVRIKDLGVTTAKIRNLAVETLKIADNAVTIPISAYTSGNVSVAAGSWTTVQTVTLANTGQPCQIVASLTVDNTGTQINPMFRLLNVSTNTILYGPINAAQNLNTSLACGYSFGIQTTDNGQQIALQFYSQSGSANYLIGERSLISLTVQK
jgi:hypothetical protein